MLVAGMGGGKEGRGVGKWGEVGEKASKVLFLITCSYARKRV